VVTVAFSSFNPSISTIPVNVKWYWKMLAPRKSKCYKKMSKKEIRMKEGRGGRGEDYKDCKVLRCSNKLDQEIPRGRGKGAKEGVHASFLQLSPFTGVFAPRREPNFEKKLMALLECVLPDLDRNDQAGETGREMSRGLASK
jgi:hypothetical protein